MITKASYIERRGASLRALDLEIARLTDYADKVTAVVAVKYYEMIRSLQTTRDKAAKKLRELRAVGDESWVEGDASTGVEEAWSELRIAVLAAISTTYFESNHNPPAPRASDGLHQAYRARRIAPRGACY